MVKIVYIYEGLEYFPIHDFGTGEEYMITCYLLNVTKL